METNKIIVFKPIEEFGGHCVLVRHTVDLVEWLGLFLHLADGLRLGQDTGVFSGADVFLVFKIEYTACISV